jgi:hypothetical protein
MYVHFYSYVGGIGKRNIIQGWPQVKHMGPYLKNKAKRGWGSGSSGRAPAKEV